MSFPCARLFAATVTSKATNFLRSKIAQIDYRERGIEIADDEIFLSDGSKSDCGFILDVLGDQNRIAITDPVYPVYVDTNVMAGHTGPADAIGPLRRASFTCRAGPRTASWRSRLTNTRTSFTFASRTIRPARSRRARSSRSGSPTRRNTRRSCSTTRPTRATSASRESRARFSKFRARRSARWSFAAFPRPADSPECAADSRS